MSRDEVRSQLTSAGVRSQTPTAPHNIFVTGTDTGVGKTVVSAAIAQLWRDATPDAGATTEVTYVKPAQSGADDGDDDARDVARWTRGVEVVTGTTLGASLAPSVAGRLVGVALTAYSLAATVQQAALSRPRARLVVEGAGGILVELGTDGTTCADLAAALALPVVVAVRPGLGTLNHTALTLAELHRRGLELAGVVVSGWPAEPDLATRTNLAELARLSGDRLLGVLPVIAGLGSDAIADADLGAWFTSVLGGTATTGDLLALAG
ncbi:MAG: dethiobiotin synthetase [Myxococcota bacterium]|jgi:dethiobiotin synthetase